MINLFPVLLIILLDIIFFYKKNLSKSYIILRLHPPGQSIVLVTGSPAFLDANLSPIANTTTLGLTDAAGQLQFDFFHATNVTGSITVQSTANGAIATQTITPCAACAPPSLDIQDPCTCTDPLNIKNNQQLTTHFHDVLTINTGIPGQSIVLVTGSPAFLDANLSPIANATTLGLTDAAGQLQFDFFHATNIAGSITVQNTANGAIATQTITACVDCMDSVPTLSQWGLMIFGLFLLNLGVFFINRVKFAL